jgi:hypothetical protein
MLQTSTLTVDLTNRYVLQSDPVALRDTVQVTLQNVGSLSAGNMRLAAYRGATICATCQSFSVSGSGFLGALDLNTAEMVDVFDRDAVTPHERLAFKLFVYDGSSTFYMIDDEFAVENQGALGVDTPPDVTPITPSTTVFGDLRLYSGSLYQISTTDGLWYKVTLAGSGATVHFNADENGITLP